MPRKPAAKKASAARKKKRASSSESDGSHASRKGARSKFEDFDVSEVMRKEENAEGAPALEQDSPHVSPAPQIMEEVVVEPVPPLPPMPPQLPQDFGYAEEVVPLAALVAIDVDGASEAQNGLLKEPGLPMREAVRVTKDDEPAPPLPTELMQLLSG